MPLNSFEFILVFLPISLVAFYSAAALGRQIQILVILVLSLYFYWTWTGFNSVWLLLSIAVNYAAVVAIARARSRRVALAVLASTIALDLAYLGYFKYSHFLIEQVFGIAKWPATVLPLGISFFTFTQIMYLVDLHRRDAKSQSALIYSSFVTFYPHLPAGPLYHYSEIMPQLEMSDRGRVWQDLTIGWTIFVIGLAKKIIADNYIQPVERAFASTAQPTLYSAWLGTLSYALQIYFDFSGYSDMAIGIARMFGIVFPENFRSPYKATSIIDFWRRWHMTLSRFLRDYLYIPLGGNRAGESRRLINIMVTMAIGGLWHGANWTFVVWGVLHGMFLIANHLWRRVAVPMPSALGVALTFLCVLVGWVFFRAPDFGQAVKVLQAMAGMGAPLPISVADIHQAVLDPAAALTRTPFGELLWLAFGLIVVWAAPNTQTIMRNYHPVLGMPSEGDSLLQWTPSPRWAILTAVLLGICLTQIRSANIFLYWNF